jgi:hypothetical protein
VATGRSRPGSTISRLGADDHSPRAATLKNRAPSPDVDDLRLGVLALEDARRQLQQLLLPLRDLGRMDVVDLGQLGHGLVTLQRFESDLGLEVGLELVSSSLRVQLQDASVLILRNCPISGVRFNGRLCFGEKSVGSLLMDVISTDRSPPRFKLKSDYSL